MTKRRRMAIGHGLFANPGEEPIDCFLCGVDHEPWAIARIRDERRVIFVPLCPDCCCGKADHAITMKYFGMKGPTAIESIEVTAEEMDALTKGLKK